MARRGQQDLPLRERFTHGGAREGAGRPRKPGAGVSHATRPRLTRHHPAHVSLRLRDGIRSLRRRGRHELVERALEGVLGRVGFAVVHYTILSNHVHLVTEATDKGSLARGAQALAIRIAKAINRADGRRGSVFRDRYHAHVLRTPAEVRHALCYVLQNFRRHATNAGGIVDPEWLDPLSSSAAFDGWRGRDGPQEPPRRTASPTSWLMTVGWRRRGLIAIDEVPAAAWT